MRTKIIYFISAIVLFCSSCIDDKGNYDYKDEEEVVPFLIEGLKDTINISTELILTPTVKNITNQEDVSYRWFCHEQSSGWFIELGNSAKLEGDMSKLSTGKYNLYFEVKDKTKDIFVRKKIVMIISLTNISTGWFVVKDIDDKTDFDYISLAGVVERDVLKNSPVDIRIPGKAKGMTFQPFSYSYQKPDENGNLITVLRQNVYHIISDKDYRILEAATIRSLKTFNTAFYETPLLAKPQTIEYHPNTSLYFLSGGKMYTLSSQINNIGLFGYPEAGDYQFADTKIIANAANAMVFETKSRTWKKVAPFRGAFSEFNEPIEDDKPSTKKMTADLVEVLPGRTALTGWGAIASTTGVAWMKSTKNSENYLISLALQNTIPYPFASIDTLKTSDVPVLKSNLRSTPREGSFLYYTKGNEIWAYSLNKDAKFDKIIKALPSGETITYMQNMTTRTTNLLVVTTSTTNGRWKMYHYELEGAGNPDLKVTEPKMFEGEGTARFVMLRN